MVLQSLQMFVYIVLRAEIVTTFGSKMYVAISTKLWKIAKFAIIYSTHHNIVQSNLKYMAIYVNVA